MQNKNMKKLIVILVLGALSVCLVPVVAQEQDWQTVSTMQGSGSAYSAQVTAVGAVEATDMATTTTDTYSPAQAPSGPRRIVTPGNSGTQQPIGDAVLPLLLLAGAYIIIRATRKHA